MLIYTDSSNVFSNARYLFERKRNEVCVRGGKEDGSLCTAESGPGQWPGIRDKGRQGPQSCSSFLFTLPFACKFGQPWGKYSLGINVERITFLPLPNTISTFRTVPTTLNGTFPWNSFGKKKETAFENKFKEWNFGRETLCILEFLSRLWCV